MSEVDFKLGDSVVVKPDVKDPDTGEDMSGWQGRITELHLDHDPSLMVVKWDSVTLEQMPVSMLEYCEMEGLYWSSMGLYMEDVMPAEPRDKKRDVTRVEKRLQRQYGWIGVGNDLEQGRRIQQVVNSAKKHDEMSLIHTWYKHLETELKFPFEAKIDEWGYGAAGDRMTVLCLSDWDETYGVMGGVKFEEGGMGEFPLCDLEVLDENSTNYLHIRDYRVWFANFR